MLDEALKLRDGRGVARIPEDFCGDHDDVGLGIVDELRQHRPQQVRMPVLQGLSGHRPHTPGLIVAQRGEDGVDCGLFIHRAEQPHGVVTRYRVL